MNLTRNTQNISSETPPNMTSPHTKIPNFEPMSGLVKKLLPLAAFFMAFTTVMAILIVYMDNTAMKHYQFRVNMSQDYEMLGVSQDNPQLVTYIREILLFPAIEPHHKPLQSEDIISPDTVFVMKLLKNKTTLLWNSQMNANKPDLILKDQKNNTCIITVSIPYVIQEEAEKILNTYKNVETEKNGIFVEAGAYNDGKTSRTEWLEEKFNWQGLLIQPDPRHYFSLRRHNRIRSQAIHACLSPTPYPKEVTLFQDAGVKINSIHSNNFDDDWFNTRVKCFPLYSLLLAMNMTTIDYFSLNTGGTELQVLETIPFERVKIEIIGIHLDSYESEKNTINKFLLAKNYLFMESFNNSYIYKLKGNKA